MGLNRRFRFDGELLGVARKTVAGCVERINQLYEQGADAIRIGQYATFPSGSKRVPTGNG